MDSKKAIRQLKQLEKLTPDKNLRLAAEWNEKWKVLISTILSANTRDEMTIKVSEKLYEKYPTVERLAGARLSSIEKTIHSVNYYKTKARHIQKTARIILKMGVPKTCEGLLKLPGVGRKVANVYLATQGKPAIGVDTHVARISKKLGWTKETNRHKIERDLMELFPEKYWNSINYILVRFGRSLRKQEDEIIRRIKALSEK